MAEILKFDKAQLLPGMMSVEGRIRRHEPSDAGDSFWPEVSQGLWVVSDQRPVNPANSETRVLSEMILILGVTAAIAAAISLFVGAPPV